MSPADTTNAVVVEDAARRRRYDDRTCVRGHGNNSRGYHRVDGDDGDDGDGHGGDGDGDGDDDGDDDDNIHYYYDAAWGLHEDPLVGFWPPTLQSPVGNDISRDSVEGALAHRVTPSVAPCPSQSIAS